MCVIVAILCLSLGMHVCTVAADPESTNNKAVANEHTGPYSGAIGTTHKDTHDSAILIGSIVAATAVGVSAIAMVVWSIYRRLQSVRNGPEMIEMETMLHV